MGVERGLSFWDEVTVCVLLGNTLLEGGLVKGPAWGMAARAEEGGSRAPGEAWPQPRARMVQSWGSQDLPPSPVCRLRF